MGRRAWQATVHGFTESDTTEQLSSASTQQWRKDKYSGCKYRTPERTEYQLQLANKVALQGIMHEKYRMSSVMGRTEQAIE